MARTKKIHYDVNKDPFKDDRKLPVKTTKKLTESKLKNRANTRNGRPDVPTDHPEGKERFDDLFKKMVNPPAPDNL